VTGGSKGLGKAMALGLAAAGADVLIVSRHEDELVPAIAEIRAETGRADGGYFVADLADRAQLERLAAAVLAERGRIDILINNAGANVVEAVDQITDEAWDLVQSVYVFAAMALTRAFAPGMKERGWGRIVHISSILGFTSKEGRAAYSAAKAAIAGHARAAAIDLGPYGITVNCLAPGPFWTDGSARSMSRDELSGTAAARTAVGRRAEPEELVGPLLMLTGDAGRFVTGSTLVVDGGWLAR